MRWTLPFLAFLSLLTPWSSWKIVVSGKRHSHRGLLRSHKLFHKTRNTINAPKLRNISNCGKLSAGIKNAGCRFTNKRNFVAAPPGSESWSLQHDQVTGKDTPRVTDTSEVEFIGGDEAVEITSGPEDERSKAATVSGARTGGQAREMQGRRQQIESGTDSSSQEASQAEDEQSNDEEYIEKENLSSDSEYGNIERGGIGLSRDNPLTHEAQNDYQSARHSMAEGTHQDSEFFHDQLDGLLGNLVKSDSALSENHHQQLQEKSPGYLQQAYNNESNSGMPGDTTRPSDDSVSSIEEIVTETEGNATDEVDEPHPQGASGSAWQSTGPSNNKASSRVYPNVPAKGAKHQTTVETSNQTSKGSHGNTAPATAEEPGDPDDVNETDIEEIDDENKEMIDGDISVLDQPSQQVSSFPNDGNNEHVEDAVQFMHETKQGLRDDHLSHESYIQKEATENVKDTENTPENPPKSETKQAKQFTGEHALPNQRQYPPPSHGATSDDQKLDQQPRGTAKVDHTGSSLNKLLLEVSRQAAKMREENERKLAGPAPKSNAHSDNTPVSNKSLGLLMHQILLNYFKNESALHGILHSQAIAAGHPLANASSVAKDLGHAAKPSNNSNTDLQPKELQIQDNTGFSEKWGNLSKQDTVTEIISNNINNNINSNDNKLTTNNLTQEMPAYMDPAPSSDSIRTSQAIKKQELNGSEEEMILVLKNKTFGVLIGRHKNATVRLLSAKSAPNSDKEEATAAGNDASTVTQPNMDISTGTNTSTAVEPQNVDLNQGELGSLNMSDITNARQQHVALVNTSIPKDTSSGSAKSHVHEKTQDSASDLADLKSLEVVLSQDFMSDWMYDQRTFGDLGINPTTLQAGVASLGISTRLKRVFRKALRGTDIKLLVVAGSISAGAGLEVDQKNLAGVYYKAFVNWWYRSMTPITNSKLKVNAVAIGGTSSEYFSYCIKNYVEQNPDIVLWELATNDYKRYEGRNFPPGKPLEQLTRILLSLPSHPALIFLSFFNKMFYRTTVGQDCPNSEDEGGQSIAKYYGIPSLSWRNVVCPEIGKNDAMSIDNLFSSDGTHPSITGHAQMASLLITFMKSVFEKTIILERDANTRLSGDSESFSLPQPMYGNNDISSSAMCWTLLTPDYTTKLHNTLPGMDFISANGFQFTNISHWPIRLDRQRCLHALDQAAILKIKFFVPPVQALNQGNSLNAAGTREVVIMSHNSFRGSARAWLDENQEESQVIAELSGQRRTQADILNTPVLPGLHTLTIQDIEQGFCLSAVAVS